MHVSSQAMEYLHARNQLHNDLKPSNIGVLNGKAKLLDFGHASALDTVANVGYTCPTTPGLAFPPTHVCQPHSSHSGPCHHPKPHLLPLARPHSIGTLPYSAPEAFRTKASDIFSLGMTMYEILLRPQSGMGGNGQSGGGHLVPLQP